MIAVLAGRRIDLTSVTEPRFPLSNVPAVRARLAERFRADRPEALVCSAASGADLLALDVAGGMGLRRRVVLPFRPDRFRTTSVTDRVGDWGPLFDRVVDEVDRRGDLIVLDLDPLSVDDAYRAVTRRVFEEALMLANAPDLQAVVVWDGVPRSRDDVTADFLAEARRRTIPVTVVPTL